MFKYLFLLGHQPHISTAEIKAVFSAVSIKYTIEKEENNMLIVSVKKPLNAEELILKLGGTIKISELIANKKNEQETIINHLKLVQPEGKIQFALAGPNNKKNALAIKKILKAQGRNVRYVEIKNTASILHNNLVKKQSDFTLLNGNIFVTRAIQPIKDFVERDFGRPESDSQSGMLPPKLAKIMINLSQTNIKAKLLDPFCGSGTILMEATFMGYENLIGSDLSKKAISDTKKNLEWSKDKFKITDYKLQTFTCDAAKLDKKIEANSVDAIITEPSLGNPLRGRENEKFLQKQADELAELYINSFKTFYKLLKKDGVVVFIIPSFRYKDEWVEINCIDKIKKIDFEPIPFEKSLSLQYWRTKQHLARNIWRFKK
jgi:tRNA G10  N-methylase Trm11